MFKLAVFSIILFVLSFSAMAEEPPSSGSTKSGQPCQIVHKYIKIKYDGSTTEGGDRLYQPYVNRTEYLSKHAAFVDRQQKRGYGPLQKNETYDCYYDIDTEQYQFDSHSKTEHPEGNFYVANTFRMRNFSWKESEYYEVSVKCVPVDGGLFWCYAKTGSSSLSTSDILFAVLLLFVSTSLIFVISIILIIVENK